MSETREVVSIDFDAKEDFGSVCGCRECAREGLVDSLVHPVAVAVNPAGALHGALKVDAQGVHIDKSKEPNGRGVLIEIHFACESGHKWSLVFHFHKGSTYTRFVKSAIESDSTIWRD